MKYYLSVKCWNARTVCLMKQRIFPVMIYCYFYTLPNLSVTEFTNNTIKTLFVCFH